MLLYESLNQPLTFLWVFLIGFFASIIFDLSKYLTFLCNNNKIMQKVFDALAVFVFGALFFIVCLVFNFGQFRLYILMAYLCGLLLERTTFGLILAKFCKFCYLNFKKINFTFKKKKNNDEKI